MTTPLAARCELSGDIVNGTADGVKVTVTRDEENPDELLWELIYTGWRNQSVVQERVSAEALREALLKDETLVHQGCLTFIVSGEETSARLYVGAFFPHQAHLVTELPRDALEMFYDDLS